MTIPTVATPKEAGLSLVASRIVFLPDRTNDSPLTKSPRTPVGRLLTCVAMQDGFTTGQQPVGISWMRAAQWTILLILLILDFGLVTRIYTILR